MGNLCFCKRKIDFKTYARANLEDDAKPGLSFGFNYQNRSMGGARDLPDKARSCNDSSINFTLSPVELQESQSNTGT